MSHTETTEAVEGIFNNYKNYWSSRPGDTLHRVGLTEDELKEILTTIRKETLEEFRKVVSSADYEWDGGKSAWEDHLQALKK